MSLSDFEQRIDALSAQFLQQHPEWLVFAVQHDPALHRYMNKNIPLAQLEQDDLHLEPLRAELLTYPGLKALAAHQEAHGLFLKGKASEARALAEAAHTLTGVDIHPETKLDTLTLIDHCTGSVIGADVQMGEDAMLYAGVVLGNYNNEVDAYGRRHPQIGSHAVISSGAKLYGPCHIGDRVRIAPDAHIISTDIGHNVVIGPNVVLDHFPNKIPDNSYVTARGQNIIINPLSVKETHPDSLRAFRAFGRNHVTDWRSFIANQEAQGTGVPTP